MYSRLCVSVCVRVFDCGNRYAGPIPTEIGRLFRLLEFDASSNQLTGACFIQCLLLNQCGD